VLIDDWASGGGAPQGHAIEVLAAALGSAERVIAGGVWRDEAVARDLAVLARFRKPIALLTVRDPFGIADLLRAGLLIRLLVLARYMRVVERDRDRLRRVVLWLGELDALVSIASLRAERADTRLPRLSVGAGRIAARGLVHPALAGAVGNDLELDAGLLVTGSNMSGKSTFLRAVAINAICAQSIHTTFGTWDASVVRVFAVMRVADATAEGMSTYAVEVAAIGQLVAAVARRDHGLPALLVIDEPFSGTNPALRVPIVVSVLDYLGARDLPIAATHDLDVAAQVDARFARGYFCEPDDGTGRFDRKLRPGVSPASNALALLVRAGYPAAIIAAVERRVQADPEVARRSLASPRS
jgi:DNA mismatch repair ATPase MutS